jgi:hypothetical protein
MAQTEEKLNIEKIFDKDEYVGFIIPNFYLGYYTFLNTKQENQQKVLEKYFKCTILIERSILGDLIEKEIRKELHDYAKRESLSIDKDKISNVFVDKSYASNNPEMYNDKYSMSLFKRKDSDNPVEISYRGKKTTDYSILKPGSKVNVFVLFHKSRREVMGKEQFFAMLSLHSIDLIEKGNWPTNQWGGPPKTTKVFKNPFIKDFDINYEEIPF